MRPLKEKISITIDSDLLEKLREKADEDCRPLSQYINLILRKYMEQKEKEYKGAALSDVISQYYDNSYTRVVSQFIEEEKMGLDELKALIAKIEKG